MNKIRKTLGTMNSDYIISLRCQIETQSKITISYWCIDYAEHFILPVYERYCPGDMRPRNALIAARGWLLGEVKLPYVKNIILNECHAAARELDDNPAAQAAARACGQVAGCVHSPMHSLGLAFYGTAAIAYDRVGVNEKPDVYEQIASEVCAGMETAIRAVAIENEPNPAKIHWRF